MEEKKETTKPTRKHSYVVNKDKVAQLRRSSVKVRTGGKGSVRRKSISSSYVKRKVQHRDTILMDQTLKKLTLRELPSIDECNFFMDDGSVLRCENPSCLQEFRANTVVLRGEFVSKSLGEVIHLVIDQLGLDQFSSLKQSLGEPKDEYF